MKIKYKKKCRKNPHERGKYPSIDDKKKRNKKGELLTERSLQMKDTNKIKEHLEN